ncbi:MAG: hypothetical protein SGI77_01045 [Pirellulaceae bacterium]|nr:hypothetical protein [Pirellulaceae bacterium]
MLAEIAVLPGVFDERKFSDIREWTQQLRFLKLALFPSTAASPYFVSNLHSGNLIELTRSIAENATDSSAKRICLDLLKLLERVAVFRPACEDYPKEDDLAWIQEAAKSDKSEAIERVIAPPCVMTEAKNRFGKRTFCLCGFDEDQFAKDIGSSWTPTMNVLSQVESIRKICVHCGFICIASPYIDGGEDDDTNFVIEVLKSVRDRPKGFHPVDIQVQFAAPDKPTNIDFRDRLSRKARNISKSLRDAMGESFDAELVARPEFKDRYIFAGFRTESSRKTKQTAIRWGVYLGHIARRGDDRKNLPMTNWHLLSSLDILKNFENFDTLQNPPILSSRVSELLHG